ncbi:MAG: DUF1614 domain-containing protein [Gammaproteobacteria bacterium]
MPSPYSHKHLVLFILALAFVVALIQVGVITVAFDKLGLSPNSAYLLLFASLFGSGVNLPVSSIEAEASEHAELPWQFRGLLRQPQRAFEGRTTIAVNVGGCVIPVAFSAYLLAHHPISLSAVLLATAVVASVCYAISRPLPGIGIGMPIFVAPIAAALIAVLMAPHASAPLAYVCGTLGVLIGADLLRLKDVGKMGAPVASIGGAGTFDGIFITGIVAVLLS